MAENIIKDLNIQFKSSFTLSSPYHQPYKRKLSFCYDLHSHDDISTNSFKPVIQNKSQLINSEIKKIEDDFDTRNEDLLLGIRDEEGNIVCNNDEYDLTEEEENYLLSDDSNKLYMECSFMPNINNVADKELFFIDVKPSVNNQIKIFDEHEVSSDITNSSSNNLSNKVKHPNLPVSTSEKSTNTIFSVIPVQKIHLRNVEYNSKTKFNVLRCDVVGERKPPTNLDDKNISISDIGEDEILPLIEEDHENLFSIKETFPGSFLKDKCLSEKNTSIDSNMSVNDKDNFNENLNLEEKVSDRDFDLSKVMSSDSARKIYLDLLKGKSQSLITSYEKYKNIFLQSPLKAQAVNEAEKVVEYPVNASNFKNRNMINLRHSYDKSEMKCKCPDIIHLIENDKLAKNNDSENASYTSMDTEISCNGDELAFCIGREDSLYDVTHVSKNGNLSLTSNMKEQQKINIEDSCDPFSVIKKDFTITKTNVLNKIYQSFKGSKYKEILNSSLYVEYEIMDQQTPLQSTNGDSNTLQYSCCKNIVSNTKGTKILHYNSKLRKKKNSQLQIPALRHSKRNLAFKQTNLNLKTLKEKQAKMNANTQTLFDLFSLNNKTVTYILWALLSDEFKTGALLTDIMKYLRREKALNIASKLKKDVERFLKAAVDAGIVHIKHRKYILTKEKGMYNSRKTTMTTFTRNKSKSTTSMNLRKR